jgi:methyl-accepting chemotaxis protein
MATLTVRAVEQIGSAASDEIERLAANLLNEAETVASKLRELANAVREHSKIAGEHVAAYCDLSKNVLETVRKLQGDIGNGTKGTEHGDPTL